MHTSSLKNGPVVVQQSESDQMETTLALADEVRHQILMLPYYGVFDWITGSVQADGAVVLNGYVVKPVTKSDLEGKIKRVKGVTRVEDNIKVLPLSPNDRRIRVAVYRTLFGFNSPLFKYATMAVPSIHIIVENGHVTLEGIADNKSDRNYANIKANGVSGVFSVTNNIRVAGPK